MKLRKYVNIEIDGQDNIGVIDLGVLNTDDSETARAEQVYKVIEEKLPKALGSHFDNDIQILELVVVSMLGFIKANGKVRILDCNDEEECSIEEVSLVETWVY